MMKHILNGLFTILMSMCVIGFLLVVIVGGVFQILGNCLISLGNRLIGNVIYEEY